VGFTLLGVMVVENLKSVRYSPTFFIAAKTLNMNIVNDIPKLKKLDRLIRYAATGSPNELAEKMNVSRATIFRVIARLKSEFEAPIYFDKRLNSYCYEYHGKLITQWVEKLDNE
jgi:hypothetical protein